MADVISLSNVPWQITERSGSREDFHIVYGKNGSGKTELLKKLATHFLNKGERVVIVSNSIFDKFNIKHRRLDILKSRGGLRSIRSLLIKSLTKGDIYSDIHRLGKSFDILEQIGYEKAIGFKILDWNPVNFKQSIRKIAPRFKPETVKASIEKMNESSEDGIVWVGSALLKNPALAFLQYEYLRLFKLEGKLKKFNAIGGIEIYFQKEGSGNIIELQDCSSGELMKILNFFFLSRSLERECVVLIDEPENSYHPEWQIDWLKAIMQAFPYSFSKFIVATHSPLIGVGAQSSGFRIQNYKMDSFTLQIEENELSIEEILYSYFGVITPENRFLSDLVLSTMDKYSKKEISRNAFHEKIDELISKAISQPQIDFLVKIKQYDAGH